MDRAWIVTSGDYSDYTVVCVAPSEEEAEAICTKHNQLDPRRGGYRDWCWSEVPLATAADVRMVPTFVYRWTQQLGGGWGPPVQGPEIEYEAGISDGEPGWNYIWGFRLTGHSPEHAAKIAQDREAQRRAEEAGLT